MPLCSVRAPEAFKCVLSRMMPRLKELKDFDVCLLLCIHMQALAGPGLSDHLHHRPPWYAEAARGLLAVAAQFSSRDDLLFWRPGSRSPSAEDHLPQEPHAGGTVLRRSLVLTLTVDLSSKARETFCSLPLSLPGSQCCGLELCCVEKAIHISDWMLSLFPVSH